MRRASDNNGHRSPLVDADQCGAICVRSTSLVNSEMEALLITSRETGRWVIPKGWSEGRKKLHRVAREEAWEEAGVRGRVCKTRMVTTDMTRRYHMTNSSLVWFRFTC